MILSFEKIFQISLCNSHGISRESIIFEPYDAFTALTLISDCLSVFTFILARACFHSFTICFGVSGIVEIILNHLIDFAISTDCSIVFVSMYA